MSEATQPTHEEALIELAAVIDDMTHKYLPAPHLRALLVPVTSPEGRRQIVLSLVSTGLITEADADRAFRDDPAMAGA